MPFTQWGRHRKALATPFPEDWRRMLTSYVAHWLYLNDKEKTEVERLIRLMLVDKYWEGAGGLHLTDRMRIVISALASIPILELGYEYYDRVTTVIVYPTSMVVTGDHLIGNGIVSDDPQNIIGQASGAGPVVVAWDAVREQAQHPELGRNVVYHEFAHQLDMLGGSIDGTPPLGNDDQYREWKSVFDREYALIKNGAGGNLIDKYGRTNPPEFFAVVTEAFFNKGAQLKAEKLRLYRVVSSFYGQDPAQWTQHR